MVDRIDKLKPGESWKIQETNPSKKDKQDQSEEEKQKEAKSRFEESPHWNRLISKDSSENKREGIHLLSSEAKSIAFKNLGPHKEISPLLETAAPLKEKTEINERPRAFKQIKNKSDIILLFITITLLVVLIYLITRLFV